MRRRTVAIGGATFLINVIAPLEIVAKLGHFNHDAAMTMAAVLVAIVLMAYWILKT